MEYLVIVFKDYVNNDYYWFDNKYEAYSFFKDLKLSDVSVSIYQCKYIYI